MRQAERDELIGVIRFAIRTLSPTVRKMLASNETMTRHRAEDIIAAIAVDKALCRYEILTDAPPPGGLKQEIEEADARR